MRIILLFAFIVSPFLCFSQMEVRKLFLGQIVADSLDVENITILNKNSNIVAITDQFGQFSIYARESDTLLFAGLAFESKSMIVEASDFEYEVLKIKLNVNIIALSEVIIYPVKLTGNLTSDSKKLKTKEVDPGIGRILPDKLEMPDDYSKIKVNESSPKMESQLQGVNFIAIAKMIRSLFSKPKAKPPIIVDETSAMFFGDLVKQKFSYHFFTQTLKLERDEIGLFLNFAETPEVREKNLLHPSKQFQLIEYLIQKSAAFHKIK